MSNVGSYYGSVDRILEPQTVVGFIGFLFGNPLPDGTRPSSIATLPMEDLEIIQGPNYLSSQSSPDSASPLHRVMNFVGSWEDQSRLCGVGKNIQSLKSRLWSGITPLSDQRWKERRLHLRENFDQACQNLGAVVAVFEYLNVPEVQDNLRQTFNLMYDVWAEVDTVLNQRRAHIGAPPISIANLWTLYMSTHLDLITQRAHKWVTEHVDTLRAPFMQDILNHEPLFDGKAFPDKMQWELGDALHILLETAVRADHTIMIPMDGYKGYKAPETGGGPPEMYARNDDERGAAYSQRVKTLSHKIAIERVIQQFSEGSKAEEVSSGKSLHESAMDQIDAQRQVRRELRGNSLDLTLQEPWISSKLFLLKQMKEKGSPMQFGFVIYRLTYGQSDSEWLDFTSRMEKHILDWGAGQGGSDAIKPYLKLHWVDGRETGIEENDIEAAKRSTLPPFFG